MDTLTMAAALGRKESGAAKPGIYSGVQSAKSAIARIIRRAKIYNRWLSITTLAAPNPMHNSQCRKGGVA